MSVERSLFGNQDNQGRLTPRFHRFGQAADIGIRVLIDFITEGKVVVQYKTLVPVRAVAFGEETKTYDLKGIEIIPFCTSGGSPVEPSVEALRKQYPDYHFQDGLLLNNVGEDGLIAPEEDTTEAE